MFHDLGDILVGSPAQSMPFILSEADQSKTTMTTQHLKKRSILYDFQSMSNEFINILLLSICAVLTLMVTSSLNVLPLAVPVFLLIYSLIIPTIYTCLMNNRLCLFKNSQLFDERRTALLAPLAISLASSYAKWVGSMLSGTQWLVVVLRRFGAQIDADVIIEDMADLDDVHLITIGSHVRLSLACRIQCHTFEQRQFKLRSVTVGPHCILKPLSLVLPGVNMTGHNRIMPCSVILPHDQLATHTDWSGSPARRIIIHHGFEPPQLILAQRQSSLGAHDVVVGRYSDDILALYFGHDGWLDWQTGVNLRQPFRPSAIYLKLLFTTFLCTPAAIRVLMVGLGGGALPMLIRHYFPSIYIDVVEINETVIELAEEFFGLAELMADGHLNVIADDAFHYMSTTTSQYDIIFMDAFSEENIPTHLNTEQFFAGIRNLLTDVGCLSTNANLSTTDTSYHMTQALSSVFKTNILLKHSSIGENARVIISGTQQVLAPIDSKDQAIAKAQQLELDSHFEFSLARLLSIAYCGPLVENTPSK